MSDIGVYHKAVRRVAFLAQTPVPPISEMDDGFVGGLTPEDCVFVWSRFVSETKALRVKRLISPSDDWATDPSICAKAYRMAVCRAASVL